MLPVYFLLDGLCLPTAPVGSRTSGVRSARLCPVFALVFAAAVFLQARPAAAQFDLAVERELLGKLLQDGHYKQALAESRRVEEALVGQTAGTPAKPGKKGKVTRPPAVTVALVELLIYRGTVERRMGNLDAAEKTLTEAYKQVMDPEFQRLIRVLAPADKEQLEQYLVGLKLPLLQLLDNGTEVLIDRLRKFNYECQAQVAAGAAVEITAEQKQEIESLFQRVDMLVRTSIQERQYPLTVSPDDPAAGSPWARMMLGQARPYRLIGMRYLEASRLPWTVPFDADPASKATEDAGGSKAGGGDKARQPEAVVERVETPVEREQQAKSQRRRAVGYLEKSRDLARQSIELAKSVEHAEEKEVFLQEEARILGETGIPLTVLAMFGSDAASARKLIDQTVEALSSTEQSNHPELARPLMVSAELAMQEGSAAYAAKDFVTAEKKFQQSVTELRRAKSILEADDSEFDPDSPLHPVLADLIVKSQFQQGQSRQGASAASAADAAARRALAALARSENAKKSRTPAKPADGKPADEKPADAAKKPPAPAKPATRATAP